MCLLTQPHIKFCLTDIIYRSLGKKAPACAEIVLMILLLAIKSA